jgi:hypothetical protein
MLVFRSLMKIPWTTFIHRVFVIRKQSILYLKINDIQYHTNKIRLGDDTLAIVKTCKTRYGQKKPRQ